MAELLKYRISAQVVEQLAELISPFENAYDADKFHSLVLNEEWEGTELKARIAKVVEELNAWMNCPFPQAIERLWKPVEQFSGLAGTIFPTYVEYYGLDDLQSSIKAMEHFTKFSTAEFAVRPFLVKYEREMLAQMLVWSKHENLHVRRLASEGCRPLLPWGLRLRSFKAEPKPLFPILENLKADPSEYVRRSVANNLNDISKDHPELVLKLAKKWYGNTTDTDKLVKHALRTLLKKGDKTALGIVGFEKPKGVTITGLNVKEASIKIGGDLRFSFSLKYSAKNPQKLRLEYGIHYRKANDSSSLKVFQLSEREFTNGEHSIQRKQSFKDMTTRKHHAGEHTLQIMVNGQEMASTAFQVEK